MMLQRGDLVVVHEPFSVLAEQGTVTIHGTECLRVPEVIRRLRELAESDVVFFKDTTDVRHADVLADRLFLADNVVHTFLVREPAEAIASYYALNPDVTLDQVGFEFLHEIFTKVRAATGEVPVVVNAADLVAAPDKLVEEYCADVGLEFLPDALHWPPGNRDEWCATDRWHEDVAGTNGFVNLPNTHGVVIDDVAHLQAYRDHHLPFYREIAAHGLRPYRGQQRSVALSRGRDLPVEQGRGE